VRWQIVGLAAYLDVARPLTVTQAS